MGWWTHTSPHLLTLPHLPTHCLHITLSPLATYKLLPPLSPLLPFSLSLHPLHSLIPYPPILIHISIYGGGRHPPHSFTLPPHLPHPHSHATYISPPSLSSSTFLPFPPNYSQSSLGSWTLTTLTPLFTSLPNPPTRSQTTNSPA
jgi:hypothetical protein